MINEISQPKINLLDLDLNGLSQFFVTMGEKPFRAHQVFKWLHQQGLDNFAEMTDLSKLLREKLAELCEIKAPMIVQEQAASDSTHKWLMQLEDGNKIETVFIPEKNRGTLCISSQVGCILNCSFCSTGKQGFNRNLTVSEIIGQIWQAKRRLLEITEEDHLNIWHSKNTSKKRRDLKAKQIMEDHYDEDEDGYEYENKNENEYEADRDLQPDLQDKEYDLDLNTLHASNENLTCPSLSMSTKKQSYCSSITNIVLMGMGEPLLNFEAVVKALSIMRDDFGYALPKRRVTLSTAGVVPNIDRLRSESDVALAISLHAPNDELRNVLVPLNKKYPLVELLAACKRYVENEKRRKITFEYVMLQGVNDTPILAKQLVKLLRDVPCKINLIPFNSFSGIEYERSHMKTIKEFQSILVQAGYVTTVRKTRGMDISAACGQLKGNIRDKTRRSERWLSKHPQLKEKEGAKCLNIKVSV